MRNGIAVMLLTAAALSQLGCGGPAIGDLRSITLSASPSMNLAGEGGTVQLFATGNYSSGGHKDLSNKVTFAVTPTGADDTGAALLAPPNTITVSPTGLVTAVTPFVCSWVDTTGGGSTPSWALAGSYQITATFKGITSQPTFIAVASAASVTSKTGQCGP